MQMLFNVISLFCSHFTFFLIKKSTSVGYLWLFYWPILLIWHDRCKLYYEFSAYLQFLCDIYGIHNALMEYFYSNIFLPISSLERSLFFSFCNLDGPPRKQMTKWSFYFLTHCNTKSPTCSSMCNKIRDLYTFAILMEPALSYKPEMK